MDRFCRLRFTLPLLLCFTALAACGKPKYKGAYKRYEKASVACCNVLTDEAARAQCLSELPRVEPAYAETESVDREARCFEANFQCDGASGRPTTAAAQKIHDCMTGS